MLKELKEAGFPANADDLSPASTAAWSNVHTLVQILQKLPKSEIATLNSTELVDAMKNAGPIDRPEVAPFDFSTACVPRRQVAGRLPRLLAGRHARPRREWALRERLGVQRRDEAVQAQLMTMPLATALFSQWTVQFALLGLATGALTALVALSLVIVHRVSGVLNFAAAALGAIGAFVCYSLRDDFGWPTPFAVAAGLVVGVLLGLLTYVVMALLRNTSLLSRLIATLALLSSAESLMVAALEQPVEPARLDPPDPQPGDRRFHPHRRGSSDPHRHRPSCWRSCCGRSTAKSLFGLATSAVSENRRVAAIAGWAPARIELVNYLIAGFLSALAAILLAPIVTLNAAILSVTVLSALAAALVGRFSSFGATVGAALVIGVLQSELSLFQPDIANAWHVSTQSLTGLPQAVPLLIILVVAVASGRARPARGETNARLPLPGSGRVARVPLALAIIVGAVLVFSAPSYSDALMTTFGIGIIIASVVVVSGYAGQLSLCQYALAGFGAWAAAQSASSFDVPFLVALLIGVVAATAVGVLVALPAIRTRGVTLAIVTLALSLVFSALIFDNPSMTGGFEGIVVKSPEIVGYQVDPTFHPQRYTRRSCSSPSCSSA